MTRLCVTERAAKGEALLFFTLAAAELETVIEREHYDEIPLVVPF